MAGFVVDASVVCCWALPDETSAVADAALDLLQSANATAPDLLWHEVRNVLMLAQRRKRIDFALVKEGLRILRGLPIITTPFLHDEPILTLAERHGLTAYDAAYLALAVEQNLPLATLDRKLSEAARREMVPLLAQAP